MAGTGVSGLQASRPSGGKGRPMARPKKVYFCSECDWEGPKWEGCCPGCRTFGTIPDDPRLDGPAPMRTLGMGLHAGGERATPVKLTDVSSADIDRWSTGISELDMVLGGGIVPGSVVLIGGAPGIGKSTLTLQALGAMQAAGIESLYVSGEESAAQVKMRAERIGGAAVTVTYLGETNVEAILDEARRSKPKVLLVDSIQTLHSSSVDSEPGNPSQIKRCGAALLAFAKSTGTAVWIIGHVTKDGSIAGPRMLDHMVDTTTFFEEAGGQDFRVLRAFKNRFGNTNEIGVFRMTATGLECVLNPSELFLSQRRQGAPGSAVVPILEGARPLLVEIQALATQAPYGSPQRVASGVDRKRLALLLAVIEKHLGLQFKLFDVFVSVAGGLNISETVGDAATAAALISSVANRAIAANVAILGEIGLGGELRAVSQVERRIAELVRMGFNHVYVPSQSVPKLQTAGVTIEGVDDVATLIERVIGPIESLDEESIEDRGPRTASVAVTASREEMTFGRA